MVEKKQSLAVGFTGTRAGMTTSQALRVLDLLEQWKTQKKEFHHGDCRGADFEAFLLAYAIGYRIEVHPPDVETHRMFVSGPGITVLCPQPYLARNHAIVDRVSLLNGKMLATPAQEAEQLRSGTWATIRYSKRNHVSLYVIWPTGSTTIYR